MRPPAFVLLLLTVSLLGCGSQPACTTRPALFLEPLQAAVSSSAQAPSNQQIFTAALGVTASGAGCVISNVQRLVYPAWTNPDPVHISISSAGDATNGTAVCHGPTAGAVTLAASYGAGTQQATGSVQLTCN